MGSCAIDKLFTRNVPHVLEKIFLSLDYESFKNCLEVNTVWYGLLMLEPYKTKAKAYFEKDIKKDQQLLWHVAGDGNVEEVNRLLSSGFLDLNFSNSNGHGLPSYLAAKAIHQNYDSFHEPPLYPAAKGGHKEVVQVLLDRGANPNKKTFWGQTPIQGAVMIFYARKGHEEVVKLLLNRGANPNNTDNHGNTPLHLAAAYGHRILVQLLLDAGADPNKKHDNEWNPLHYASANGHEEVVRLLLDAGAYINQTNNNDGWTPLHYASAYYHKDTVQVLLDRGACPKMQTRNKMTPLDLARLKNHRKVAEIIEGHLKK